ncbi:hypothetical protein HNP55_004461 [Paucibacter oligotrophus]|uniref:Reverse transcriptase domain-containing protein n=1 Tax=Roseateles oligotrophus TaxID=1769250 RepID=A0A840LKT6_9BURK|nr:antiviral reverse transcriptase Drt3a [Roseateles oligotrophus]MBB4845907.1 hypothetical protein [Roseateles oligotrophus]
MDQSFSTKSFWRLLRRGDPEKYSLGVGNSAIRLSLSDIETQVQDEHFAFSSFKTQIRNGCLVLTSSTAADEFVLRKIADNLRRALNISSADRNSIVPQVIQLAKEAKDETIHKFDIKGFFESIDRSRLLIDLKLEPTVSPKTIQLIANLFNSDQIKHSAGLPRGLSVSSILSEYYLRKFEDGCRRLPYCYFYTRYVDDALFFCHGDASTIESDINKLLPTGLTLNARKTTCIKIDKDGITGSKTSASREISYLGYSIKFPSTKKDKFTVSIPEKKVSKIKSRIAISIMQYIRDEKYEDLILRIRFLTSNFKVGGSKQNGTLYSGIYYNHQYINKESATTIFKELDCFLQKLVYSKTGSIGTKLSSRLNNAQRRHICSHSFLKGHSAPVFRHFKNKQLGEARGVWAHA